MSASVSALRLKARDHLLCIHAVLDDFRQATIRRDRGLLLGHPDNGRVLPGQFPAGVLYGPMRVPDVSASAASSARLKACTIDPQGLLRDVCRKPSAAIFQKQL